MGSTQGCLVSIWKCPKTGQWHQIPHAVHESDIFSCVLFGQFAYFATGGTEYGRQMRGGPVDGDFLFPDLAGREKNAVVGILNKDLQICVAKLAPEDSVDSDITCKGYRRGALMQITQHPDGGWEKGNVHVGWGQQGEEEMKHLGMSFAEYFVWGNKENMIMSSKIMAGAVNASPSVPNCPPELVIWGGMDEAQRQLFGAFMHAVLDGGFSKKLLDDEKAVLSAVFKAHDLPVPARNPPSMSISSFKRRISELAGDGWRKDCVKRAKALVEKNQKPKPKASANCGGVDDERGRWREE